jgi:hypothetical protein
VGPVFAPAQDLITLCLTDDVSRQTTTYLSITCVRTLTYIVRKSQFSIGSEEKKATKNSKVIGKRKSHGKSERRLIAGRRKNIILL